MITARKAIMALTSPPQGEQKCWYRINAKSAEEAEVFIYEEIGYWGVTADAFVKDLQKIDAKTITLRLNTPGGSVFDGVAIYNALLNHPATVNSHIDGLAASMGSIIALAGDTVHMAKNASYMIHNPWSIAIGDAASMRKEADVLDKIAGTLVSTYADKTGKDEEEIRKMMDDETWLTAEEAKEHGFVDVITGEKKQKASFDLSVFSKVPEHVKALARAEPEAPEAPAFNHIAMKRMQLNLTEQEI